VAAAREASRREFSRLWLAGEAAASGSKPAAAGQQPWEKSLRQANSKPTFRAEAWGKGGGGALLASQAAGQQQQQQQQEKQGAGAAGSEEDDEWADFYANYDDGSDIYAPSGAQSSAGSSRWASSRSTPLTSPRSQQQGRASPSPQASPRGFAAARAPPPPPPPPFIKSTKAAELRAASRAAAAAAAASSSSAQRTTFSGKRLDEHGLVVATKLEDKILADRARRRQEERRQVVMGVAGELGQRGWEMLQTQERIEDARWLMRERLERRGGPMPQM
jgi:hypothetical protein